MRTFVVVVVGTLTLGIAALTRGIAPGTPRGDEARVITREQALDASEAILARLEERADRVAKGLREIEGVYLTDVYPAEAVLRVRAHDPMMARRVAWAAHLEATRWQVPTGLVVGVIVTENPWLVPDTIGPPVPWGRDTLHAVGIMQVMPFHLGTYADACGDGPLTDVLTNVCYGTAILARYIDRALNDALLDYNGCVDPKGRCQQYPRWVRTSAY